MLLLLKKLFFCAYLLLLCNYTFAQDTLTVDFDSDGIKDVVSIISIENGYFIQYKLSSQKPDFFKTPIITIGGEENTISVTNNILIMNSQFMRSEFHFKFRFSSKLNQMILIGYDYSNYGNASNDGSGNSSWNLITGQYAAKWNSFDDSKQKLVTIEVNKKLRSNTYYLNSFSDKTIEELENITYQQMPEKLR